MTLLDIVTRCSQRLAEGVTGPVFYPKAELIAGVNEGQRLFCLLTLALESTVAWTVPPATTFFHMLQQPGFGNWIAPLRLTDSTGAKVRPLSFADLTALDSGWTNSAGAPVRYAAEGVGFLGLYRQPPAIGTVLNVTYARAPLPLALDTDIPETPQEYHPLYVEYGIYRIRQVEGAQEFAKVLPLLASFLAGAQVYADFVRARNKGSRYDSVPFELANFDKSALLKTK